MTDFNDKADFEGLGWPENHPAHTHFSFQKCVRLLTWQTYPTEVRCHSQAYMVLN